MWILGGLGVAAFQPFDHKAVKQIERFRGQPGSAHCGATFNADGFFDEAFVRERRPGVRRIAAFSDSFGVGVVHYDDNFLTRLDRLLDRDGAETEVYNFSIAGIGIREYVRLYETEARAFAPDEVLVCVFLGNDLADARDAPEAWRPSHFRLPQVIRRFRWFLRPAPPGFPGTAVFDETRPKSPEAEYLETERRRARHARQPPTSETREMHAVSLGWLFHFHDLVGDRLRVVIIPDEYQVSDALWAKLALGPGYHRTAANWAVGSFLRSLEIPFLDLTPALCVADREGRTYVPCDSHWNRRGNEIAAREIATWLSKQPRP